MWRLAKGLRILQVSINSYFSRCCIILEFDFFFKVELPREDSKFELKKKQFCSEKNIIVKIQRMLYIVFYKP